MDRSKVSDPLRNPARACATVAAGEVVEADIPDGLLWMDGREPSPVP
jgi:hypothetical protein